MSTVTVTDIAEALRARGIDRVEADAEWDVLDFPCPTVSRPERYAGVAITDGYVLVTFYMDEDGMIQGRRMLGPATEVVGDDATEVAAKLAEVARPMNTAGLYLLTDTDPEGEPVYATEDHGPVQDMLVSELAVGDIVEWLDRDCVVRMPPVVDTGSWRTAGTGEVSVVLRAVDAAPDASSFVVQGRDVTVLARRKTTTAPVDDRACTFGNPGCTGQGSRVEDPYVRDVYNEPGVMIVICPNCLDRRAADI